MNIWSFICTVKNIVGNRFWLYPILFSLLHLNYRVHAKERPNIVLIMADDMGFSDIGCYGGEIETPNLDTLAAHGIRFSHFYNGARCCPSRASLLTGLYGHQAGIGAMDADEVHKNGPGYAGYLNSRCVTIAEALKSADYFTAATGKWHIGAKRAHWPLQRGFDRYFGSPEGGGFYFTPSRDIYLDNNIIYPKGTQMPSEWYGTFGWTEYGIKFIDEALAKEKPFFLYIAHIAPHFPIQAPKEYINKYLRKYRQEWNSFRLKRYQKQKNIGLLDDSWPLPSPVAGLSDWNALTNIQKARQDSAMAAYAATVECLDKSIGTLVQELKRRNIFDNTLIMFLSDNGGCDAGGNLMNNSEKGRIGTDQSYVRYGRNWANVSNTPFQFYKKYTHEGGIAAPLIFHWPDGIKRGNEWEHQVTHIIDIMPTCIEVSGGSYPRAYQGNLIQPSEGISLVPIFSGGSIERKSPLFWEHLGNRAIREGKWKLVAKKSQTNWQLYDMEADRTELKNLAQSNPTKVNYLKEKYNAWAERAFVIKKTTYNLPPTLELVYPKGGEILVPNSNVEIKWGFMWTDIKDVKVEYSIDNGQWRKIIEQASNSYIWKVPDINSNRVKVRVTEINGNLKDISNEFFSISPNVAIKDLKNERKNSTYTLLVKGISPIVFKTHFSAQSLRIYNVKGRIVHELAINSPTISWDGNLHCGKKCGAGTYFIEIRGKEQSSIKGSIFIP